MRAYKLLKYYEGMALHIFNAYAFIFSTLNFKKKKLLKKNSDLRRSSKNHECFILMGGVSAKEVDKKRLVGKDIITANNFFKTDDYKLIRPKYHVITDAEFFNIQDNIEDLKEQIQDYTTLVLNVKHAPIVEKENWNYIFPAYRVINSKLIVNLTAPCSNFSTVTLTCIQLAIYLGYKQINIIGFDLPPGHMPHYYKESEDDKRGKTQFDEKKEEFEYCQLFWQYTNCQHECYKINEYAKKLGVEIFNLSKTSFVRAFPHREFGEI